MSKQQWRNIALILFAILISLIILIFPLSPQKSLAKSTKDDFKLISVDSALELKDVQLTDWSFQAIDNFIKRYKVIFAYPDKTFRGNEPLTRGENAQWINQLTNQMENDATALSQDLVSKDEFASLERTYMTLKEKLELLKQQSFNR